MDFKRFDYENKRAIYSQCQSVQCPNLEIEFVRQFLDRKYSVLFVTFNQPPAKIKPAFGKLAKHPNLFFIADKRITSRETDPNTLPAPADTLEDIEASVRRYWRSLKQPRFLFFDCAEILLMKFEEKQVFDFVHRLVQEFQQDGIVAMCFLKDTMDRPTETRMQHLFDQTIFL